MGLVFETEDLDAIRAAAAKAESRTSGEIVPYFVQAVDDYPEAEWKASWMGAIGAALFSGVTHRALNWWGGEAVLWIAFPALLGATVGWLIGRYVPAVRRLLVNAGDLERRVRIRAEAAFLDEEVFATRDRTGIMIFVGLFERRAVILADSGIHQRVGEEKWSELVDRLVEGLRAGRAVAAMAEVIGSCGQLLEEHGVELRSDDVNELDDSPRVRRR